MGNEWTRPDWPKICAACANGTPPERCAYYGEPNGCNAPTLGTHPEGELAEQLQEALEKAEGRIAELERNARATLDVLEKLDYAVPYVYWNDPQNEVARLIRLAENTARRALAKTEGGAE